FLKRGVQRGFPPRLPLPGSVRMRLPPAGLTVALTVLSALAGCDATPDERAGYRAVATVGMITDIVRNVAGEHAEVIGLIGEGVDPHLYKPTRNDVAALSRADIIF